MGELGPGDGRGDHGTHRPLVGQHVPEQELGRVRDRSAGSLEPATGRSASAGSGQLKHHDPCDGGRKSWQRAPSSLPVFSSRHPHRRYTDPYSVTPPRGNRSRPSITTMHTPGR
jgi:hypothetical protein